MDKVSKKSVPVLTATILNAVIYTSLFIYQLLALPHYKEFLFGEPALFSIFFNILVTALSLLIAILLVCNRTTEDGHVLAYLLYGMVVSCVLFTVLFQPVWFEHYFNLDHLAVILIGIICSGVGLGLKFSWRAIKRQIRKEFFTVDNIRYYFADNIFLDDRRTVKRSILMAAILFALMALLITKHPLTRLWHFMRGV